MSMSRGPLDGAVLPPSLHMIRYSFLQTFIDQLIYVRSLSRHQDYKMLPYRHIPVEKKIVKIVHELIAIQGNECS